MKFSILDTVVFVFYGILIITVGIIISYSSAKKQSSKSYFFANKSLPWYIVGTSIIAANISAEQFIGMSGSGFAMGLTIATYEWIAAPILLLVAWLFLPVFFSKQINTMPQFLEIRYNKDIKTVLAVFWIVLFVFVNLTSILYLGALSLKTIFGVKLIYGILGLAIFSAIYTISGGLKAIAVVDIIQVCFLLAGGLLTTYLALNAVSDGGGAIDGARTLMQEAPEKFKMILPKNDPNYKYVPGIRSIIGGIWIAGIYYFGANQYIIQKALASKSLREAQRGMAFAAYLKMLLPVLVVVPGIAAFVLGADISKPDEAYPWLMERFIPSGIKGLVFAALIAAIVSSLSAIINSTSTIFTMDIYKPLLNPNASERNMLNTGRISGTVAIFIAVIVAPLLSNIDQVFQFIQEYTGLISPGITALFVFGLFWKGATTRAAWIAVIITIPVSLGLKLMFPLLPFLDNMAVSFIFISIQIIAVSLYDQKQKVTSTKWEISREYFRTGPRFKLAAFGIIIVFATLYTIFW